MIKNINLLIMLENLLDVEDRKKIKNTINNVIFSVKFYCVIITLILLLNVFYLYMIHKNINSLSL